MKCYACGRDAKKDERGVGTLRKIILLYQTGKKEEAKKLCKKLYFLP